jgi:valyl-tRNA synthetase
MNKVSKIVYDFVWHDFCDWYLEMIKSRLYGGEPAENKLALLDRTLDVFDCALRLLHPLMPFLTEELWQRLQPRTSDETIMRAQIPRPEENRIDIAVERQMVFVQNVIEAIRTVRGEMSIAPSKEVPLLMGRDNVHPESEIRRYEAYIQRLGRVGTISFIDAASRPRLAATAVVEGEELFIPLEGLIDLDVERARLQKEIERLEGMLSGIRTKLKNPSFIEKAPKDVVDRERDKEASVEEHRNKLVHHLTLLVKQN